MDYSAVESSDLSEPGGPGFDRLNPRIDRPATTGRCSYIDQLTEHADLLIESEYSHSPNVYSIGSDLGWATDGCGLV